MMSEGKDRVEGVSIEGGEYGLKSNRPVDVANFEISDSDVGIHLGEGSSGSIVSGGTIRGGRIGIMIGGDPELEKRIINAKGKFPALDRVPNEDILRAVEAMQGVQEKNRAEVLRFSSLGQFLAEGGFVGWANLAASLIQWWTKAT